MRTLMGLFCACASVGGVTRADIGAMLEQAGEGWWLPDAAVVAQEIALPIDVNHASIDALLQVPGLDYALVQLMLSKRPFTPEALLSFCDQYGCAEEVRAMLYAQSPSVRQIKDIEMRVGSLFNSAPSAATTRAGGYYFSGLRAHFNLPGTHAAGAGLVSSVRPRTHVAYDIGKGSLTSSGPQSTGAVESGYIYAYYPRWRGVLGSYTVGFGERLVFDQGAARQSDTWGLGGAVHEDISGARLRFPNDLFGGAFHLDLPQAAEAVMFWSSRFHDIYQYDLRYGPDAWAAPNLPVCVKSGATHTGYVCGDDGLWYKHEVSLGAWQDQTLRNAVREDVQGAHVGHQYGAWRYGLTAYRASATFSDAWPMPRFSPNAKALFGGQALGVNFLWEGDTSRLAGEAAYAQGDVAFILRSDARWGAQNTFNWSARYFGPNFRNPHGHAEAAADQVDGYVRRNEAGLRTAWHTHSTLMNVSLEGDAWLAPFTRTETRTWIRTPSPSPSARLGLKLSTRSSPHRGYVHGFLQHAAAPVSNAEGALWQRTAWRIGTSSRWAQGWRSGVEYRALVPSAGRAAALNQHALVRVGRADVEAWMDIASAPQGDEPRAQGRVAAAFAWDHRVKIDVQYGVFYTARAPVWRHVVALGWEGSF